MFGLFKKQKTTQDITNDFYELVGNTRRFKSHYIEAVKLMSLSAPKDSVLHHFLVLDVIIEETMEGERELSYGQLEELTADMTKVMVAMARVLPYLDKANIMLNETISHIAEAEDKVASMTVTKTSEEVYSATVGFKA